MVVLITGATGFLGRWVTRAFVQAGHRPRLLLRRTSPADLALLPVELARGDVLDLETLERALRGADAIVHVAGLVSLRGRDRAQLERINVTGTANVLRAAARCEIPVLHTSSIATAGYTETPEPRNERCFMPASQASEFAYAGSKLRAERLALSAAERRQHVVVVNPGLLFGPGDAQLSSTQPLVHYLRRQLQFCLAGGISVADVRDVADVYPTALVKGQSGGRYLLGATNLTYRELFDRLSAITGLTPAWTVPRMAAHGWGMWSELAAGLVAHSFEEINPISIKYGSLYNYCDARTAVEVLGYRPRDLTLTLCDTVADQLARGAAHASTPQLQRLLSDWRSRNSLECT